MSDGIAHGTPAGASACWRRYWAYCPRCRAAKTAYARQQRATDPYRRPRTPREAPVA